MDISWSAVRESWLSEKRTMIEFKVVQLHVVSFYHSMKQNNLFSHLSPIRCDGLFYCSYNKNKIRMHQSFKLIKCPSQQPASTACLSHYCSSPSPFQCQHPSCKCHILHERCKIMRIQALQGYLMDWQKWVGKSAQEFIIRIGKIYANARDKLVREQKVYLDYCKDLLLGKDYSQVMFLLQKREFAKISSELLCSSLNKITEVSSPVAFQQFTLSQMTKVDNQIKNLTQTIQSLYKSKYINNAHSQRLIRSNSTALTKSSSTYKEQNSKQNLNLQKSKRITESPFDEIMTIKIDLAYPKFIDSLIVKQASQLNKLIGKKIRKYHMSYRASQNYFSVAQFYRKNEISMSYIRQNMQKSNVKRDLLSLIILKSQFGKVIGGFTSLAWSAHKAQRQEADSDEDQLNPQKKPSQKNKFRFDFQASTNIFSLDLMERYDLLKPQEAIYCGRKSIGFGKNDIRIMEKGNANRKNYCKFPHSYNFSQKPYLKMSKSGMILSGNQYSPFFKITEWQAFIVEI